MGNRDKRDDKIKKPKRTVKTQAGKVRNAEVLPPVGLVKRKRKERLDED